MIERGGVPDFLNADTLMNFSLYIDEMNSVMEGVYRLCILMPKVL